MGAERGPTRKILVAWAMNECPMAVQFLDNCHHFNRSPASLKGLRKSLSDFKLISNRRFWVTNVCSRDFWKPQMDVQ
jgi:hypothetical protein